MNEIERKGAICCESLSLRYGDYGDVTVLEKMSLNIPRGAVVGLVGRNGAGKSTLLRALVGLSVPSSGHASLLGCPSEQLNDDVRARLGYVAQTPDLFEWMSVQEHLRTIGRAYPNWNMQRALVLAIQLHLPLARSVRNLSGGDQQKLAVVLALAHDPEVLILDEPVSSLDPMTRRDFMRALFAEHGASDTVAHERTVLISSHLLSDLERVVSHVAFMRQGRLQLFDTWDAMLEHLRLVPRASNAFAPPALVCQSAEHCVIDTRHAPEWIDAGRVMSLDELFAELNA